MKDAYYLSRAYVEFGPFPSAELVGFNDRGLLKPTDYIFGSGTENQWMPVAEWISAQKPKAKVAWVKKTAPTAKAKVTKTPTTPPPPALAKKAVVKKPKATGK